MKRVAALLGYLTIFILGAVLIASYAKYTITSGEKHDDFSGATYGYKVEQYYFKNDMRLTIWNKGGADYGMNMTYELPRLTIDKVVEERWINNDAAIYLNLQIKYHDSVASVNPARIIYDYHRGEIYVSSGYTLWRIWNEAHKPEAWMTKSEFDEILSRLSR